MKKTVFSFLILILILFSRVAYAEKDLSLTLHPDVFLGVVDASIYQNATYEGGGSFQALTSDEKEVNVEWKKKKGTWRLLVKAIEVESPIGVSKDEVLSDFYWRGGEQKSWVKFSSLENFQEIARSDKKKEKYEVEYKYQPDINDIPGSYKVTLRYSVELYRGKFWQQVTFDTVDIRWQVKRWGIVKVEKTINLGTIDASIYKNATPEGKGKFSYLKSGKTKVFVICNDPGGWRLEVLVIQMDYPPHFSSNLLKDFFWRVNKGPYQSAANLDKTATTVDIQTRQGSKIYQMGYRYLADLNDIKGEYEVKLQYRLVSANNHQIEAEDTSQILWEAQKWIIFVGHKSVDLGVLDKSKVSIDSKGHLHFKPLESLDNPLFVMSNSTRGWKVKLKVTSYSAPPYFKGDLLKDFQWKIGNGKYHSVSGLDKKETKVVEEKKGPLKKVYHVDYRYRPDIDDVEGEYKITLQYTVYSR